MTASTFDSTLTSLGINRTTGAAATGKTTGGATTLGQNDFLKLMTAQMQNQDPFAPVDNTQMVAQMAQFSSLAGISDMSTTLKAISDKLGATTTADAVSYIGKTVLVPGGTAYGRTSGGLTGGVELSGDATNVNVTIADQNGQVLKTMKLGAHAKGTALYDWDGKTDQGADAGTGPFTVTVTAQNSGVTVPATGLVWAPVQSVSIASGKAMLSLPGIGDVDASTVRQIG
ncbi:flagellar hook capping FlgD N-terminal domain-containing protein [uncultured Sphingomonas sp.]|uniref:flagellar hook assembly protein FlgD n=1 Tax=uncultured Sphingomonas sp. TaxID=158754 RepID=UPI0026145CD2|nr:flagellar hook capping FlgD N-terminal domain-containing protein [uncultured Sphingomonas sp.]